MPRPPRLLGSILGSRDFEQHVHAHLEKFRLKGEWFEDCAEVRAVMQRILAGDDLGFKPVDKVAIEPSRDLIEITPEEWLRRFRAFVYMVFPGDPAGGFADLFDLSREEVASYLTGETAVPDLIADAWGAHLVRWVLNKHAEETETRNVKVSARR